MFTDPNRPLREDPVHPEVCPVFTWHQLVTSADRVRQIETECRAATLSCFDDKKALAEAVISFLEPIRKKRKELEKDPDYLFEIIRKGNEKARAVAAATMAELRTVVGFWP